MVDFKPTISNPPPQTANEEVLKQMAHGSNRTKQILEVGELRSSNYIEGSQGWRLTPDLAEFNSALINASLLVGGIGGFTINPTSLVAGTGANTVGLDTGGTNPAFYAGSATPGSAPFRVTSGGALTATNATITGAINATSGTFSGTITASGTITGGTITGATITGSTITTGTVGENVDITLSKISLRNGATETGYLRGFESGGAQLYLNEGAITLESTSNGTSLYINPWDSGESGSVISASGGTAFLIVDTTDLIVTSNLTVSGRISAPGGELAIPANAGAPSGGNNNNTVLDTTNSRIYFKVAGTWKYAALT